LSANRVREGGHPVNEILHAGELQVLSSQECMTLLASHEIGRLGVNAEDYPVIFPVNYGVDHGVIVIRTDAGSKLSSASHANVTFEVDDIDRRRRSGWSVLVKGLAEEVTAEHRAELIERTRTAAVEPWAPGEHGHWLRLIPHAVSGRRIVPGELPPIFERGAYL
jgi:nitroimidazol reductase NimA-like FMN-containing flavoprotein (pyridoxamine 5'-phosphate oxidase superfamily)